ncbi:MAG: hypothetical protein LUD17_02045 [Bacteroidales bacterium]|nr:hypothetical protein [Bacteroidales bacterium]
MDVWPPILKFDKYNGRTILTAGEAASVYDLSGPLIGRTNGEALTIAEPGLYIILTPSASTKVVIS